jgi:4-amino-4-deoxy-L-arabinose transferase-like glycosyltransferase
MRDALVVTAVALVARLSVVAWAGRYFPATADGTYYHTFADRLAKGAGYTWAWPDGAVTFASHYPVGYPGLLALPYRLFGAHSAVAMTVNALLGAVLAFAMYVLLARVTRPKLALAGGLVVALHPALVPYTAALMTEGATVALVAASAAAGLGLRNKKLGIALAGLLLGVAILVRPQCLVLAPAFGLLFARGWKKRLAAAVATTALALAVVAPWTARNCVRMKSCALVSVNGGWNLAIGQQTKSGAWEAIDVPPECREVWDEAGKDACFGRAARKKILDAPLAWAKKAPEKLAVTFDYFGGAPWYLHQSNPTRFPYEAKVRLGAVETVVSRLLLLGALFSLGTLAGTRRIARASIAAIGAVFCFLPHAYPAYLVLVVLGLLLGRRELVQRGGLVPVSLLVIVSTAALHAIFFGAGRYGLVCAPFVAALAFVRRPARLPSASAPRRAV